MFYTGIDWHKAFCYLSTVNAEGKLVQQRKVRNTAADFASYYESFDTDLHTSVVESCGGWYWLSRLFDRLSLPLVVAHAHYVKAIAYAKVKTDKVDSMTLAHLLRMDYIPTSYQLPPHLRGMRDLMRARLRLVQKQVSFSNMTSRLYEKFNVTCPDHLPADYALQHQLYMHQHDLLEIKIKEIEASLKDRLLPTPEIQRLLWIPGIGMINAYSIFLEIGEISRFADIKHFYSYCRLAPGASNSGNRNRHKSGHKSGNRYLKLAFTDAAVHAIRYYPVIFRYFRRMSRRKARPIARNLVAKNLAKSAYHVLKDECDFNHTFKGMALEKKKSRTWPRLASPDLPLEPRLP